MTLRDSLNFMASVQLNGCEPRKLVCKSRILPKKSSNNKAITTSRAELLATSLLFGMADKTIAAFELRFTVTL